MTIRYNKEMNEDIRSIVRNYNKRRKRMAQSGYSNIPEIEKVSDLKKRYTTYSDLKNELDRLKSFTKSDVIKKLENDGGVKAVKWQFDTLKSNQQNAKAYIEREIARVSKRTMKYPGERYYLNTLENKLAIISSDIKYMGQQQFRSAMSVVKEFQQYPSRLKSSYRGFMREVEVVMDTVGIPEDKKDAFFRKFSKLTPEQFLYIYDNNDIIARIYSMYMGRDEDGNVILNTKDDQQAEDLLDVLMEEADDIILDAKKNG